LRPFLAVGQQKVHLEITDHRVGFNHQMLERAQLIAEHRSPRRICAASATRRPANSSARDSADAAGTGGFEVNDGVQWQAARSPDGRGLKVGTCVWKVRAWSLQAA
jgi:hypothetical protein